MKYDMIFVSIHIEIITTARQIKYDILRYLKYKHIVARLDTVQ